MTNWDDFISLYDGLLEELEKMTQICEGIILSCKSITKSFEGMHQSYNEFIEIMKKAG